jgi:hypothetical protein
MGEPEIVALQPLVVAPLAALVGGLIASRTR